MVKPQILAHLMDRRRLYCTACHAPREGERMTVEQACSRGAVIVTDMPARRCPACGAVYVDVQLGALVEEITAGRIGRMTMADVMALAGVSEGG